MYIQALLHCWVTRDQRLALAIVALLCRPTPSLQTGKTDPLPPNGAFILGAEQDCYGGCTERDQAFRGYMDEVRLWRRARTQAEVRWGDMVRVTVGQRG